MELELNQFVTKGLFMPKYSLVATWASNVLWFKRDLPLKPRTWTLKPLANDLFAQLSMLTDPDTSLSFSGNLKPLMMFFSVRVLFPESLKHTTCPRVSLDRNKFRLFVFLLGN